MECAIVTVQFSRRRSCAIGLPTMFERPTTTASSPARSRRIERMSSMQPSGVQETKPGTPVMSRPALIGWKPSTSLSGSIASITFCASICGGSGSCTRMPSTCRIGVEPRDERQELGFAGGGRQQVLEGAHARLRRSGAPCCARRSGSPDRRRRARPRGRASRPVRRRCATAAAMRAAQARRIGFPVDESWRSWLRSSSIAARRAANRARRLPSRMSLGARSPRPQASRLRQEGAGPCARSRRTASLAAPSSGTARTRTFRTRRPSTRVSMPSIASRPPRGVTRTRTSQALRDAAARATASASEGDGQAGNPRSASG